MPAVLQRKGDLWPLRGPLHQQQVTFAGGGDGFLPNAASNVIKGHHGALV